ncbi:MAG: pyrroline-5-carboxylate reductase [Deltaproteobacteria bacterium RIFCSPLOWO2_12_FULL_60_19]|nr:MAG: pyrroline-5-carboxylate reductase [Deltaproteobacteria bacterium RIFCSPLOWO2_12_FULL_60_19]
MLKEKIGVIGAGKIGSAIARGMIRAGLADRDQLMVSDVSQALLKSIATELQVKVTSSNAKVCDFGDIVILAVKPQIIDAVLKEIAKPVGKGKLVVSVAAGVPLARIESHLAQGARVVRVMPNIACVVGAAASCYAGGTHAGARDIERVGSILSSFGIGLPLEEKHLDAVTGLSGSGPAYVFLFIEALADGGVQMGLSRDVALKLALQTVYGAARMALESGQHLGQLRDEVTSPGGTTIAGLYALEKGGIRGIIMEAVLQATRRSEALGKDRS